MAFYVNLMNHWKFRLTNFTIKYLYIERFFKLRWINCANFYKAFFKMLSSK